MYPAGAPSSARDLRIAHVSMVLLVLAFGLCCLLAGEKVPAGGGFGWDGITYAAMVRSLDTIIGHGELSSYYAQRIGPSAIVRLVMTAGGLPFDNVTIIRVFEAYNLILLTATCLAWQRTAGKLAIGISGQWLGFLGIFVNFAVSKQALFYPVLTDVTALFMGSLLVLFYVERSALGLFLVGVAGSFCWPTLGITGTLLLLFLDVRVPVSSPVRYDRSVAAIARHLSSRVFIVVAGMLASGAILYFLILPGSSLVKPCTAAAAATQDVFGATLARIGRSVHSGAGHGDACRNLRQLVTAVPSMLLAALALLTLVGSTGYVRDVFSNLRHVRRWPIALAVLCFVLPKIIIHLISNPAVQNPSSIQLLAFLSLFPADGKIFLPFVGVAVLWGPLILLSALFWPLFAEAARQLGAGVVAVLLVTLPFVLVGEPRFLTAAWPLMVLVLVLAFERFGAPDRRFTSVLTVLSVSWAQFWLPLTFFPWKGGDTDNLLMFPKQLYFMHYGLWMNWPAFAAQFLGLSLTLLVFWVTAPSGSGSRPVQRAPDRTGAAAGPRG